MTPRWHPRLSSAADRDLQEIIRWTARHFGAVQARSYRQTVLSALRELENGPEVAGSRVRDEIMPGVRSLHVARHGRRGRHFLIYRASGTQIEILRILHDGMELRRHFTGAETAGRKRSKPGKPTRK